MKEKYSVLITCLKGSTYAVIGALAQTLLDMLSGGLDWKSSVATGLVVGMIAGAKNFAKHYWNIDIDLTKIKN